MIEHTLRFTLPAAYALLPPVMATPAASAFLLAIGLQESRFKYRRQEGGPARGLWQFERNGVYGVLTHESTKALIASALDALQYREAVGQAGLCHLIISDNDTLAAVFARLLIWTAPQPLPETAEDGLAQYLDLWRPGKPHPESWPAHWAQAWEAVRAFEGVS